MTDQAVTTYEIRRRAAWITLNSPNTRNALSGQLIAETVAHLKAAFADDEVRSVVLTGNGKAFCAGADLKNSGKMTTGDKPAKNPFVELLELMRHGDKPVICAINGAAFGGGLGLVAAGDIAIAVEGAKFSFSEVRLGVVPAIISVVVLPKLGEHQAMRLFLTGERFEAQAALDYGLLHAVVPADGLVAAVEAELDLINLGGPKALGACKKLIRTVTALPEGEAFEVTAKQSVAQFGTEEAAEGMRAFGEKRKPSWVTQSE